MMSVDGVTRRYKASIMDANDAKIPPVALSTVETPGDDPNYIVLTQSTENIVLSLRMAAELDDTLSALISRIPD